MVIWVPPAYDPRFGVMYEMIGVNGIFWASDSNTTQDSIQNARATWARGRGARGMALEILQRRVSVSVTRAAGCVRVGQTKCLAKNVARFRQVGIFIGLPALLRCSHDVVDQKRVWTDVVMLALDVELIDLLVRVAVLRLVAVGVLVHLLERIAEPLRTLRDPNQGENLIQPANNDTKGISSQMITSSVCCARLRAMLSRLRRWILISCSSMESLTIRRTIVVGSVCLNGNHEQDHHLCSS